MKNMTLRLDDQDAAILEMIARIEGRPIAEVLRESVEWLIAQRAADAGFMAKYHQAVEESSKLFERFSKDQ
jgi:DNA polymerase elongation subunit (family B)